MSGRDAQGARASLLDAKATWLGTEEKPGLLAARVKLAILERYRQSFAHIEPALGDIRLSRVTKRHVKELLAEKLRAGLSRDSVRLIHGTLRALYNAAIDDGLVGYNPTLGLGKGMKLVRPPRARQEEVKAMSREQLTLFLAKSREVEPEYAALFLTLARTGLRLGEALALQWDDLALAHRELRVERAFGHGGRLDTPKSGHGRTVDMSDQLCDELRRLETGRKAEKLRQGWKELPPWVFCTAAGIPLDRFRVSKAFKRTLKGAELPTHFSPHSLRHSFASLLLQQGESPVYVQRQLGHASIQLTVDTYGKWLPIGNKTAVDRLDDGASGSKVVADAPTGASGSDVTPLRNRLRPRSSGG